MTQTILWTHMTSKYYRQKDTYFEELIDSIDKIVVGEYFGSTGVGGNYWKTR